jgi:hypothetical protein
MLSVKIISLIIVLLLFINVFEIYAQVDNQDMRFAKKYFCLEYSNGKMPHTLMFTNDTVPQERLNYKANSRTLQNSFCIGTSYRIAHTSLYFNFRYKLLLNSITNYYYQYKNINGENKITSQGTIRYLFNSAISYGLTQKLLLNSKLTIDPFVNCLNLSGGIFPFISGSDTSHYANIFGDTEHTIGTSTKNMLKVGIEAGFQINYTINQDVDLYATSYFSRQFANNYTYIAGERASASNFPWLIWGSKHSVIQVGFGFSYKFRNVAN